MTEQEKEKYPAYFKSIFSNIIPNSEEVEGWKENVLEKVRGNSILPHYISKDKDFDIFWGWIIHFFAIIVVFCRNFKRIFIDYKNNLDEIGEFMKQRDYIKDSRVQIDKDLKINITQRLYHNISVNSDLDDNGNLIIKTNNYCTDFIPITQNDVIILKVLGYIKDINEYTPSSVDSIKFYYYYADKTFAYLDNTIYSMSMHQAKLGRRFALKKNESLNGNPYCYIRITYPASFGEENRNIPLYLGVFFEGEGDIFQTENSEKQIFNVFSDFRKRGTFKGSSLIKKILETKKEDNFYADYLPQANTGWFLNKTSPIFQELFEKIKIDALIPSAFAPIGFTYLLDEEGYYLLDRDGCYLSYTQAAGSNGGQLVKIPSDLPFPVPMEQENRINSLICLKDQYFLLNQNTSIIMKWIGDVYIESPYDSLSDSEGYELLDKAANILVTPEIITPSFPSDTGDSEVIFFLSIYDKDKNLITDTPLLGNWNYDGTNKVVTPNYIGNGKYKVVSIKPKYNYDERKYYAELPIEILDTSKEASFPDKTYDKNYFITNNKLYLFTKKNNSGTHEAYYIKIDYIQMIYADIKNSNGYNGYDGYLGNFEIGLYLRKLPITMGFLNIKQYYLCNFKNNSSYTNSQAEEIIDKKILPYNGYRLFVDNSYYKNNITIPLQFTNVSYKKGLGFNIRVKIQIKGGIPPYKYYINETLITTSYSQDYEYSLYINDLNYFRKGILNISVADYLNKKIYTTLNYNSVVKINYKIRLFVDTDYNIRSYIKILGSGEKTCILTKRKSDSTIILEKTLPRNIFIDITDFLYSLVEIQNKYLELTDIENHAESEIILGSEFRKFGLDIYDNGEGELIEKEI